MQQVMARIAPRALTPRQRNRIELLTPKKTHRAYVVVVGDEVVFQTDQLGEAIAFRLGRREGAVFGRMIADEVGKVVSQ